MDVKLSISRLTDWLLRCLSRTANMETFLTYRGGRWLEYENSNNTCALVFEKNTNDWDLYLLKVLDRAHFLQNLMRTSKNCRHHFKAIGWNFRYKTHFKVKEKRKETLRKQYCTGLLTSTPSQNQVITYFHAARFCIRRMNHLNWAVRGCLHLANSTLLSVISCCTARLNHFIIIKVSCYS